MHRELFEIPFVHLTVWSFGAMMVLAFLVALALIKRLSSELTPNTQLITNTALYSLIAGVAGARLFYIVHHFEHFQGRSLLSVFAIWQGGLEFYGGVLLAIPIIAIYLRRRKLPVRRSFDIFAIVLILALAFGRIGCFLNGCCFGKPADLPWAIRFPYGSYAYQSQVYPDLDRNRPEPHLKLPAEFFDYHGGNGSWLQELKPYEQLTPQQKQMVDKGPYRCLPVHPTQLYSSAGAVLLSLILYLFWRRSQRADKSKKTKALFVKPGCTFALAFVLYGITRFFLESLRDDNPLEYGWWAIYKGGTVSQNLGIYLIILGLILLIIFQRIEPHRSK